MFIVIIILSISKNDKLHGPLIVYKMSYCKILAFIRLTYKILFVIFLRKYIKVLNMVMFFNLSEFLKNT